MAPPIHPAKSCIGPLTIIHPSVSVCVVTFGIRGSLWGHFWHTRVTFGPRCGTLGSLWCHFGLMCGLVGAEMQKLSKSAFFQMFSGGGPSPRGCVRLSLSLSLSLSTTDGRDHLLCLGRLWLTQVSAGARPLRIRKRCGS